MPSYYDQHEYDIRCEWGLAGISQLSPSSEVFVIVDVFSFSTSVDIAVENGAIVYPYGGNEKSAARYALSLKAVLANFGRDNSKGYSLFPASLMHIPEGTRLVLSSPNGASLSLATGTIPTFAGCLRNARVVAQAAQKVGKRISIIPAGERWKDGSLRPALEDFIGAGAIINNLNGTYSPEAEAAEAIYSRMRATLTENLQRCSSGKELIGRGHAKDVELAAALNQSFTTPLLIDGAYRNRPT
jgi:2-phosphosulfolactate phosphatase